MNTNNKNDFYIYNPTQNIFFIEEGLVPEKIGKSRNGDAYLLFKRNEQSEKVFDKWCTREH